MLLRSVVANLVAMLVMLTLGPPTSFVWSEVKTPKAFDWVDTSSPRATLKSLLAGTQRYYDLIRQEGYTQKDWRELSNIIGQAERLFDLRDIPPGHSHDVAHETTALVREALARVPLPNLDEVPGEDEMAARIQAGKSVVYRVPGTPFEITRTETGPYTGRYQFTKDTVQQGRNFYDEIKTYPYQPDQADMDGLYSAYFLSPGPLIPSSLIRALPETLLAEFSGNTIWQWLFLIATTIFFAAAVLLVHVLLRRVSKNWTRLNQNLLLLLRPLTTIVLAVSLESFLIHHVRLTGGIARAIAFGNHLIILSASVVATVVISNVLAEFVVRIRRFEGQQLDQQLVRLIIRLVAIVIAVVIVIEEMQQIGFSLATLVAGASVTGLAVALAAQDALKNIIGGIELALDKPFEVGQRVKMKDYDGYIEEIGLRSTKIRTLTGHQVTIPNEGVSQLDVENIGRRPYIRRRVDITITYDTPPDKVKRAVEILKELLSAPERPEHHPNEAINQPEHPPRVYFNRLNSDSLNIRIFYWYYPPDFWQYHEHADWINLQILERFNSEGIDFAFPTQTLYHASDKKRPLIIGQPGIDSPLVEQEQRLASNAAETNPTAKDSPPNAFDEFSDLPVGDDPVKSAED